MEFKERLRELRQEAGYSMATLGELIGVSKAAIGNYEAGIRVPRQDQLESLADIFNVDLDYLCCRTDKKRKVSFSEKMIYSGFRVSAFSGLLVRLEPEWYFQGGVKTKAGKDRIVPIHSGIRQIVAELMESGSLGIKPATFNRAMRSYLPTIGIVEDHTPHDCRHTFSRLCEKYGVPEADRKRLMGHSFGADITNGIYGHRTLEELRESIELIKICIKKDGQE